MKREDTSPVRTGGGEVRGAERTEGLRVSVGTEFRGRVVCGGDRGYLSFKTEGLGACLEVREMIG